MRAVKASRVVCCPGLVVLTDLRAVGGEGMSLMETRSKQVFGMRKSVLPTQPKGFSVPSKLYKR